MTLLDISKIKNKDASPTPTQVTASTPKQAAPTQTTPTSSQISPATKSTPAQTNPLSKELNTIKQAVAEGLSSVTVDKSAAEKKYEEIKIQYDKLTKEDKAKAYDECMKLYNALK
ncbi:MAG: hypothetical protein ACLFN8_02955 [Candidatus Woesearchaeota archaeon]